MNILLVKPKKVSTKKYEARLLSLGFSVQTLESEVLINDRALFCREIYSQFRETIDVIQVLTKDLPVKKSVLGTVFNIFYSSYLISFIRYRKDWEKTAEHELLHKADNLVFVYTGKSLNTVFGVIDFDEDVVHGRDKRFVEYQYDEVWKKISQLLTDAITVRKQTAILKYQTQIIIKLRQTLINLIKSTHMIKGLQHPVEEYRQKITQKYGVPIPSNKTGVHIGEDLACPVGTPVKAPFDGTVTVSGTHSELGNYCHFEYTYKGQLFTDRYLHLLEKPKFSDFKQGQIIALTGNTGKSTGPHIHYDVHIGEANIATLTRNNWRERTVDPSIHYS